jgi:DNA-binding Lrp family transcriptional regulator
MKMNFTPLEQQLINHYQKGFPLTSRPFKTIAEQLSVDEATVLTCYQQLEQQGILSRIGPVFNHQQAGVSTLAAIACKPNELSKIADIVSAFDAVNHNYAREHHYNLWFVITTHSEEALNAVINQIEQQTQYSVLVLPMVRSFHIDLAFPIDFANEKMVSYG